MEDMTLELSSLRFSEFGSGNCPGLSAKSLNETYIVLQHVTISNSKAEDGKWRDPQYRAI